MDEELYKLYLSWALDIIQRLNGGPLEADEWGEDSAMYQNINVIVGNKYEKTEMVKQRVKGNMHLDKPGHA